MDSRLRCFSWLALGVVAVVLAGCVCYEERRTDAPATTAPAECLIVSGPQTQVYHFCDCRYAKDIADKELLGFANPGDAEKTGRIACAACRPREKYEDYLKSRNPVPGPAASGGGGDNPPRSPSNP